MTIQRYSVTPYPISVLLAFVQAGEIAIPEIQRPFVWKATQVRDLLDSLYQGFPIGYLITWKNPTVKLKDGSKASGKKILIDGQQRITALTAALLGREVLTKDYATTRVRISFHPGKGRFEVSNPAIAKDAAWLPDIADMFSPDARILKAVKAYVAANPGTDEDAIFPAFERLLGVTSNLVGIIELADDLDIETVTEIFIRVNSAGAPLSQADFAMSKIAVNETYRGAELRKAIDYFCHLAAAPEAYSTIEKNDPSFAATEAFRKMAWLRNENDDIYDPAYTDLLRVAFTTQFHRGKLEDLVALLSGRNFETKQFEDAVVEDSFGRLWAGFSQFANEHNFKSFLMIIRSAGFVSSGLIGSQTAIDFAYILYLTLRGMKTPPADVERLVRRWFVMSILTGRYSGSPESTIDYDIRQIDAHGIDAYSETVMRTELSDAFWEVGLPQAMDTSANSSPYFRTFVAAQVKLGDLGFLSRDIAVKDLVEVKSDVHHIFPRQFLKNAGLSRSQYNQIANFAVTQSEINIAIGKKEPQVYLAQALRQCNGGRKLYGNIDTLAELERNFAMNCIPDGVEAMTVEDYQAFLAARRKLMAARIRMYFEGL